MKKKETNTSKKIEICFKGTISGNPEVLENVTLIEEYIESKLDEIMKELNKSKDFKLMKSVEFELDERVVNHLLSSES